MSLVYILTIETYMARRLLLLTITLTTVSYIFAQQQNPIALTINNTPIYKSEIEEAYNKGGKESKESIDTFIEGYINFKLNVLEAKAQHLDTTASYIRQYNTYRARLAAPYLQNTEYEDRYIKNIYNRILENVEINHVMFPFEREDIVLPSDTLSAYKKAIEARAKILKKGFSNAGFDTERSGARFLPRTEKKNGYIGWVSPFMLAADVEDAVYTLPKMAVSMPIRSARGYHIVQVLDKRQAMGSADIEQVVFNFTQIPPSLQQIDSVGKVAWREYNSIKSGNESFDDLCEAFIRVHNTEAKSCHFGVVGLDSNLPSDFTMAALGLKEPGEISKPVMSDYGFHIIRLIKRIPVPSFDQIREQLKEKIYRSDKSQKLSDEKRSRLKSNFNIKVNDKAYDELAQIANKISPREPRFLDQINNSQDIILNIDGQRAYPVSEFAKYISYRQNERQKNIDEPIQSQIEDASPYSLSTDILKEYFEGFTSILLADYENNTLEQRYPDFAKKINTVSEDLLFSEIQNNNIWSRSRKDEKGLADFFNQNKNKYSLDGTKYKGLIVYAQNEEACKKAEKIAKNTKNINITIDKLKNDLNKDSIVVKMERGVWSKGENPYVDNKIFGAKTPQPYKGYPFFFVTGKEINTPEDFTDVRNAVEKDYQEYLDREWTNSLRNKYNIEINRAVINTIK